MNTVLQEHAPTSYSVHGITEVDGFLQIIPGVLSEEECKRIIHICEDKGFVPASLYTDKDGVEHFSKTRKSYRCIVDSRPFADTLWERIRAYVPEVLNGGWIASGLNDRLRILRYGPGDEFKPHADGSYMSPEGYVSKITVLIYLNAGYKGGYTCFMGRDQAWTAIEPGVGMIAMQDQGLLHCVPPLEEGIKYALRTEVMYRFPLDGPVKIVKLG